MGAVGGEALTNYLLAAGIIGIALTDKDLKTKLIPPIIDASTPGFEKAENEATVLPNIPQTADVSNPGFEANPNDPTVLVNPANPTTPNDLIMQKTLEDFLMTGGTPVGWREKGAGEGIQTLTKPEFDDIVNQLLQNATPINTSTTYEGQQYLLPDGRMFGIRESDENGKTLDLDQLNIPGIRKIHFK